MSRRDIRSRKRLLVPVKVMTAERKFWLCDALRRGRVSRDEVMAAHEISNQEMDRWIELFEKDGVEGLRSVNRRKRAA